MQKLIYGMVLAVMASACGQKDNSIVISRQDMALFEQLKEKNKALESERREERELLDRLKAKESAHDALKNNPSQFIRAENAKFSVRGFINTYSKVVSLEFINRSQMDVTSIQGKITYLGEAGEELATVPFTAEGEVGAGERKKLNVSAGEISSTVKQWRAIVEKVRIVGG